MENNVMALTELTPKRKSEPMIRPSGGGIVEKAVVVGGGLAVVYTFAATLPIASVAALVGIAAYCWDEVGKFRSRETSDQLAAILNASTPKHPSINEVRAELKRLYPAAAINRAIESMVGQVDTVYFKGTDKHPLAPFGEVVCWINPEDKTDVKLPIQRLEQLLEAWGLIPTVDTTATPHQGEELASTAPTMATTTATTYPGREELIARLKQEAPELLRLVKAPPIRLVGLQRTGKSTFAQRLALLRMVLLPGHTAAWATPHREADNPVPAILNPVGYTATGAKDYPSIEALWVNTQERIDQGEQVNMTVVWDEFGGYDQFQDVELLKGSLRSLLREATKHSYHPILIAHGDQASFYPGVTNILSTIKLSTVKVETIGAVADVFGAMAPTGKASITWLDGSVAEVTWPAWLTQDYLLGILQAPPAPPAMAATMAPVAVPIDGETSSHNGEELPEEAPGEMPRQDADKIEQKIMDRLTLAGGEWVSLRDLTALLFNQTGDRETARQVIYSLVNTHVVETQERLNPNKTVSYFFRLKKLALTSTNDSPADPL
jgi:hypothetical protein